MVEYKSHNIPQAWILSREKESYATLNLANYSFWSAQMPWHEEWTYKTCLTSSVMTYLITSEVIFTGWEGQLEQETKVTWIARLQQFLLARCENKEYDQLVSLSCRIDPRFSCKNIYEKYPDEGCTRQFFGGKKSDASARATKVHEIK